MVFAFYEFLSEFFFFVHEVGKVFNLLLAARYLISSKVVVNLLRKNFIRQSKSAHLLQEILYFDKVELFEGIC